MNTDEEFLNEVSKFVALILPPHLRFDAETIIDECIENSPENLKESIIEKFSDDEQLVDFMYKFNKVGDSDRKGVAEFW
ncbi:hypothetical protein LDJ79_20860 [Vibrio tritonius]|uniref:Uncharacterized protein n=1 Tax=Vibrio tritonius TaxID=1435069 RepID=A0ABS7YWI7_9VIBR|nr:hypothetical protein [Vibrio tritonius]MCA2018579.1 hypothetical protein [Vibrio tritonius]